MTSDKRCEKDDKHRSRDFKMEDQALRLSEYNESLGNRSSTSMKFDWMQLLGDPVKSGTNNEAKLGTNDKGGSLRESDVKDNATRPNYDRKHYGHSEFSGLGGFQRKLGGGSPGPGLALSSLGSGDLAKSGTNDKRHSLEELNLKDCYGAKAAKLDTARKHYRESEYSNLVGFERKLMDENPKPGVTLSSRGSDESVVYQSLARESYKEAWPASFATGSLALVDRDFSGSFKTNSRISSGRDRFNAEMIDSTIIHDALDGQMCGKSNVTRTYLPADDFSAEEEHENTTYDESWKVSRDNVFRESDYFHVNASVPDDYSHSYFETTVDKINECCYEEISEESRVLYDEFYFQGKNVLVKNNLNMSLSPTRESDNDIVDHGSAYGRYEREQYVKQRSPLSGDDHGYERSEMPLRSEYDQYNVNYGHRSLLLEEDHGYYRSEIFPFMGNDQYLDDIAGNLSQRLAATDSWLIDESSLMFKRKHVMDDISTKIYTGSTILNNDERGVETYYQSGVFERLSAEDRDVFNLSMKPRCSHSQVTQSERESYQTTPTSLTEQKSAREDIMKRLGPRHQNIHALPSHPYVSKPEASVRKRLGPVKTSKPSVKQRLGPGFKMNQIEDSPVQTQKTKKLCQRASYNDDNSCAKKEPFVADFICTNVGPHENSEEFKQLVHSAYFRFVKQLNENCSQRRRILEQGKAGRLKCIVCGRSVFDNIKVSRN